MRKMLDKTALLTLSLIPILERCELSPDLATAVGICLGF